jgi:hypothetical protein
MRYTSSTSSTVRGQLTEGHTATDGTFEADANRREQLTRGQAHTLVLTRGHGQADGAARFGPSSANALTTNAEKR